MARAADWQDDEDSDGSEDFNGPAPDTDDHSVEETGSPPQADETEDALMDDGLEEQELPAVARTFEAKKGSSLYKAPTNEEMQSR